MLHNTCTRCAVISRTCTNLNFYITGRLRICTTAGRMLMIIHYAKINVELLFKAVYESVDGAVALALNAECLFVIGYAGFQHAAFVIRTFSRGVVINMAVAAVVVVATAAVVATAVVAMGSTPRQTSPWRVRVQYPVCVCACVSVCVRAHARACVYA